jgi:exoribonuclease R
MKEVNKKLEEIKITDEYIKNTKRKDFRNELVFTIDPYTSKDLDDAIHVKVID